MSLSPFSSSDDEYDNTIWMKYDDYSLEEAVAYRAIQNNTAMIMLLAMNNLINHTNYGDSVSGAREILNRCVFATSTSIAESNLTRNLSSSMSASESSTQKDGEENSSHKASVVFVLGGPGSGKGTQCAKIVENFGFTHLCAGELLQVEIESGSEKGEMINTFKKEGKIVPSEVTVKLLQQAMQQSENRKFIIDGFPRNEENRTAFENIVKIEPEFVLFFECSGDELTRRLLNRNQGRVDDNTETIQKRLKVYFESTLPVINYYDSKRKVLKVDAQRSIIEVFEDVKSIFSKFKPANDLASTSGRDAKEVSL